MALFSENERVRLRAIQHLSYCNPFLPERIAFERTILGKKFIETGEAWHKRADEVADRPNIDRLTECAREFGNQARERLNRGTRADDDELSLYVDVVLYYLYNKYQFRFFEHVRRGHAGASPDAPEQSFSFYSEFQEDLIHYLGMPGIPFSHEESDHLFSGFFQIRRAFHHIYDNIIGGSMVSAKLRAAVWQSIFTVDMRRYRRVLYKRMGDITTLISGPSGTGKELVARAIGLSRYIPFNRQKRRFAMNFAAGFFPVNLSALSRTLIESELFGHAKGSFTGAVKDRTGLFELCPEWGAVFLDEIGELDPGVQVKLLRVLQMRTFQRIGDLSVRRFDGKAMAATNRNLERELREGRFREDLYYRLCSDIIVTPSLREQLAGSPEQLHNLLLFIARRVAGEEEAEVLTREVERWIHENLGDDYAWPGNVRELEQCVRNYMIRHEYRPPAIHHGQPLEELAESLRTGQLSAQELLEHYCTITYARTSSYTETARLLGLDRRTVRARVKADLLERYR
ncbi:MAG: sigma-54-dependent Fis family transcriptional regulator [Candidatus Hydrogenedentes bacterium]|nr:sigma-54-dependent Fis family transcriptional regulator [Candidatus Hydrogenedentota bacterium]